MVLHEPAVWLLDEISQRGVRKMLFKKGDGGGRQDDVAESPESKEKDGSRLNVRSLRRVVFSAQFLTARSGSITASSISMTGMSSLMG
jgi:hypothetical protein